MGPSKATGTPSKHLQAFDPLPTSTPHPGVSSGLLVASWWLQSLQPEPQFVKEACGRTAGVFLSPQMVCVTVCVLRVSSVCPPRACICVCLSVCLHLSVCGREFCCLYFCTCCTSVCPYVCLCVCVCALMSVPVRGHLCSRASWLRDRQEGGDIAVTSHSGGWRPCLG